MINIYDKHFFTSTVSQRGIKLTKN